MAEAPPPMTQQFMRSSGEESSSSVVTLLVRHLPEAIPHDTLTRLFSHYGATTVRPFTHGRVKNCAFVDFNDEMSAYQAQKQLHGLRFLGKVLSVERASKETEVTKQHGNEREVRKDPTSMVTDASAPKGSSHNYAGSNMHASEPIAEKLGLDYPFPPYLEYVLLLCFWMDDLCSFHYSSVLGSGGFGKVYKGCIDNGKEIVAIKRLKQDLKLGKHQFDTEVETLSGLQHVNLVSLIGYCREHWVTLLAYEYMAYGTLSDHLHKQARKGIDFLPLSWRQRLKICIGVGRALDYLHTGQGVIHGNLKPRNILLDENFVPKVSDYGLAKLVNDSEWQSQDSTTLGGVFGYMDPSYHQTCKVTRESDIYSFGLVLLEVLCGRAAVGCCEHRFGEEIA